MYPQRSKPNPRVQSTTIHHHHSKKRKTKRTFALAPPPKGLFPFHTAAAPLITESTVSPTYLPTVSLASFSSFLGLTFFTALLATLSAFSLIFGVAEEVAEETFFLPSSGFSVAAFFTVEAAFLAVDLGLEAAALAVAAAFFFAFAGDLEVDFFVMPADLVREPAPEEVAFFFWGEGAAGLGAEAFAFSCGGRGLVRFVL